MNKKMKWITLSLLTAGVLSVSTTGAFVLKTSVAADTPPTIQGVDISSFVMEKGAGVRVSGDGLRFSAEMSKTTYEELEAKGASYGMLIVPENYISDGYELTEENVFVNNKFYFEETNPGDGRRGMINLSAPKLYNKDDDANVEIYGAMTGIGTENIYREFIGVAYVQVPTEFDETTGEATAYDYKFAQYFGGDIANNTRSMYYTAQRTLELTDWEGDMNAVQSNYIDKYDAHIAEFGYTFGYTEKHVLTKLDGTKETLTEEIKYGDLNSTVSAEYYNDPALYSAYYCTDSEMPSSKLYANGLTNLTVNYKEVAVDFDNMKWSADLTESNFKSIYQATVWGEAMGEDSGYFSVTTEIPEGGVEGTYLYFNGAKYQETNEIQVHMEPAYSKGYYQSILNTGLPFVVKYDVYVENTNADYTKTSTGLKGWNGTASFNSNVNDSVTIGQWKTVTFDLSYLVNNWGNYRIFGLELQSYQDAGQKVNFYLGNIRIEEKPKIWAMSNSKSLVTHDGENVNNNQIAIVTEESVQLPALPEGVSGGSYIMFKQTQNNTYINIRIKPHYDKSYYELLLKDKTRTFKVVFDVYFETRNKNGTEIAESGTLTPRIWKTSSSFGGGNKVNVNQWYTYSVDLSTLVNDWGSKYPRLVGAPAYGSGRTNSRYFFVGNIRLVEE